MKMSRIFGILEGLSQPPHHSTAGGIGYAIHREYAVAEYDLCAGSFVSISGRWGSNPRRPAWETEKEFVSAFDGRVDKYNQEYLHLATGYRSPNRFEKIYNVNHMTNYEAASQKESSPAGTT